MIIVSGMACDLERQPASADRNDGEVPPAPSDIGVSHGARLVFYEDCWSDFVPTVASLADAGASLAQLVRQYDDYCGGYYGFTTGPVRQIKRLDLSGFPNPPPPFRLTVVNGHYVSSPVPPDHDAILDFVARCVGPDVDCVVEFGSGLGFNLARLRLRLPTAALTYVACEPSASGREVTHRIFATDPGARLQVHPFDYAAPDLNFLKGFRNIVALTSHSVEQMPVLGERFYRLLLDTNVTACVHVEPVGWQRWTNIKDVVLSIHRDPETWRRYRSDYVFMVDDAHLVDNAAIWSALAGYNTDLLSLIAAAAERGEVSVSALAYEIAGINPFNPSTLVAWRRNPGAKASVVA
jgi:hypothetical protein